MKIAATFFVLALGIAAPHPAVLLFCGVFLVLLTGFPVAFALGGVSVLFAFAYGKTAALGFLPLRIWGILENYVLIAVPLFIFMGIMLEKSGIAEELLETCALLLGRIRGGLAITVVLVGALLAASTGIVGATVVTMGLLSLPTMLRRGYHVPLCTGTICASGTLGQIIPPSIVLVLLGSQLQEPIGDMFLAAVIPGLMLVGMYLLWIVILGVVRPEWMPLVPEEERAEFAKNVSVAKIARALIPPVLLVLGVLGSIFAGIATPTEASAVGVVGAGVLAAIRGKLSLETLRGVSRETALLTSMVFMILIGATAFSLVFRSLNGHVLLQHTVENAQLGPLQFLLLAMLVMFIAGFFIDFIEIIFIFVPVLMPICQAFGLDMIWVGILISLNLQTSFLTPPFGFALFYLKGVAPPEVSTHQIYRGIIPFIIIQALVVAAVFIWPEIALWLPGLNGE